MVIPLAIVSALGFAASTVTVKRGLLTSSPTTAWLMSSSVAAAILAIVVAFDPPARISVQALGFFALAGVVGDGLGRLSIVGSVDKLGPSVTVPIQTAAYPLVAVLGGILVFAEHVTGIQVVGAVIIIAGVWTLFAGAPEGELPEGARVSGTRRWQAMLLATIGGVGFAMADVLRKVGLAEMQDPAFGALIAVSVMLVVVLTATASIRPMRRNFKIGAGWGWLVAAGGFIALALLSLFEALETGAVSVIGPIIAAQPLGAVLLSALLLRKIERITLRLVMGTVLVVAGVALIAVAS